MFGKISYTVRHNTVAAASCIVVAIVYMIILSLIQSALQAIFQAAVYMHTQGAMTHAGPQGFPVRLLNDAMSPR
ncbi:MAG: hypothetical protein WBD40_16220 [Tepidisphaeraceae bacterium]